MKLLASLFFVIFSISASANIEKSLNNLERKTQECMNLPNNDISHISDSWLISLDNKSRKIALLLLKDRFMSKCIKSEERDFIYQLYIKHSQENDKKPMENWLRLKENDLISQFNTIVDENFLDNVTRLSNSEIFKTSFDVEDALNAIDN
ncbi:hypothetical protein [Vibrio jasicida]|uniref:hypothetical protein n=1 Tax=Vibrio jasicida TaxID=766224 RepID=UPI0005ED56DB|nr:hypothetical protein [Vibrio jasicida]